MTPDRLVPLDRPECLRLLAGSKVGRVVYSDRALPACLPVSFRLTGDAVVFRTASGGRLAAAVTDAVVAFQVDQVDEDTLTGWSVLVTGVASAVHDVSTLLRLEQLGLVPWAGGDRHQWVRIAVAEVTGRRILPMGDGERLVGAV